MGMEDCVFAGLNHGLLEGWLSADFLTCDTNRAQLHDCYLATSQLG